MQTVRAWVERWAPPIENDTETYIRCVCQRTGLSDDFVPDINNKEQMCSIVSAMTFMENGKEAAMPEIERGWELV